MLPPPGKWRPGPCSLEALGGDLEHPAIGLVILLVIQVLNIYKPPGLTRYGQRKQQEQRGLSNG